MKILIVFLTMAIALDAVSHFTGQVWTEQTNLTNGAYTYGWLAGFKTARMSSEASANRVGTCIASLNVARGTTTIDKYLNAHREQWNEEIDAITIRAFLDACGTPPTGERQSLAVKTWRENPKQAMVMTGGYLAGFHSGVVYGTTGKRSDTAVVADCLHRTHERTAEESRATSAMLDQIKAIVDTKLKVLPMTDSVDPVLQKAVLRACGVEK